jgi:DNA polymerase-3 subunit delta
MQAQAAEGGMGDMNTTILDGRNASLDELRNAVLVMPFLADRRMVIVYHPLARLDRPSRAAADNGEPDTSQAGRKKERQDFLALLDLIPPTTALVLAEQHLLEDTEVVRKVRRDHWLVSWAKANPQRAYYRVFELPRGEALASWIQSRARDLGGQINLEAALELGRLVGNDTRSAENELLKLLAYANYSREVEYPDVVLLVADGAETNIFDMVDALGERKSQTAAQLLNRLLEDDDPGRVFGMVVRQFRLLIMAREVIEAGGSEAEIARQVRVHPFVARKLNTQARRFAAPDLESIYRRLLEIDRGVKTSQLEMPVALNMLVAATGQ